MPIYEDELSPEEKALLAWYDTLPPVERAAVHYWLHTGDPLYVDALRYVSPRLKEMDFEPFTPEPPPPPPVYVAPDYSHVKALPIDLLPQFKALPFPVQVRLRANLWLAPAGHAATKVAQWLNDTLDANPTIDAKTLDAYWREYTIRPLGQRRPFEGHDSGHSLRAYWYAVDHYKAHRRRKLKPDEVARCEAALVYDEPMSDEDALTPAEIEAARIADAAWNRAQDGRRSA